LNDGEIMAPDFHTLQDFLLYTEGISYWLMAVALCVVTGYWLFLSERDDD